MRSEFPAQPFFFERRTGVASAVQVRKYAAWLAPLLKQRWEKDDTLPDLYPIGHPWRPNEPPVNPSVPEVTLFTTRKICRVIEWRPWADWALSCLVPRLLPVNMIAAGDPTFEEYVYGDYQPGKEDEEYKFPARSGLLKMKHVLHFDAHVRGLMDRRREAKLDPRYFPPGSEPV